MGNKLFGRKWAVTIGPPGSTGKRWEDLDIEFKVEKCGSSTPNKVELSIYNLSAASRGFVEKRKQAVLIEAGYEGEIRTIASGEIDLVTHIKVPPDWITKIEAADGLTAYGAVVHEVMGPGSTEAETIRKLAKKMGVTIGSLQGLSDRKFGNGRTLTGPARMEIDALCRTRGLRWSIHDGALVVYPIGGSAKGQSEAVLLNADSGLIGSPEKTEKGWKIKSLLRGGINPGDPVKIDAMAVKGIFSAEKVTHEGSTFNATWYTEILAVKL